MKSKKSFTHLPIEEQFNRAYTRALKFLSYRPRSEKEVRVFLSQKGFETLVIENVIKLFREQQFLNDLEFSKWWTEQRQGSRAKSKLFIKQELKQKGIEEGMIEETFEEAEDDFETAKKYFEKRKKRFEKYSGDEYLQKAAAFLQRRGFSWEVVKKVLKEKEIT